MLQRSQSARIVIVSSELHKYGSVTEQPELMDDKAQWSVFGPYNNTKLANVGFSLNYNGRIFPHHNATKKWRSQIFINKNFLFGL